MRTQFPPTSRRAAIVSLFASLAFMISAHAAHAAERPNFLIVLADDLGYGDLACYGHPETRTPSVDRLAAQGTRFTDGYSAGANCSPSRTGLMTGRTPYRAGIHTAIPWGSTMHLRRSEVTIASLLRQAGYATCHVGKWHLNSRLDHPDQPTPNEHGFEHWFSTQNNALPSHHDPDSFFRDGQPVGKLEGYSADIVAAEAIRWLREDRASDRPFFLYMCFNEPHEPINTNPRHAAHYHHPSQPARAGYYGNITQMDAGLGQVLTYLDEAGLSDDTFVLFTSDNGPANTKYHPHGSSGPLRAEKNHVYDGGIRVPFIIRWPKRVAAGAVSNEPVCGVDLFPTVCAIVGVDPPADRKLDGANLLPALVDGGAVARPEPLYWQYNRANSIPKVAMRVGDWKILATLKGMPMTGPGGSITDHDMRALKTAELDRFELYNLRDDIGETRDLAAEQPERLAELAALLAQKYAEVRDEGPVWPASPANKHDADRTQWSTYGRDL